MEKYEELIERYQTDYSNRFDNNKDKLIEAFVLYYGEEFRDKITNVINDIVISWNVNFDIVDIYENFVSRTILTNRIKYTADILKSLGFDISEMECKACLGKLYYKNDELCINPGMIITAVNEKDGMNLDKFLIGLYGRGKIFNFNYEDDLIYNFYSLSNDLQKRIVKLLFNKDTVEHDCLKKIDDAIEYMNCICWKKDYEKCYVDFLVVSNYLNCNGLSKKIMNKFFDKYTPTLVGSYKDVLSQEEYRDFVEFKKKFECSTSCQSLCEMDSMKVVKMITFPILCTCDEEVIHELNHGITSEVFGIFPDGKVLERYGLAVVDDMDNDVFDTKRNLEEYLNQASSLEITDIFHKLGGVIFDEDILRYNLVNLAEYNMFLPLINSFYSTYKDILKKVRVTGDLNLLYKYANKEVFGQYVQYVNFVKSYLSNVDFSGNPLELFDIVSEAEIEWSDIIVQKMRTSEFNEEYLPEGEKANLTDFKVLIKSSVEV